MAATLPFQVLLLGGASGVGKTSISYRLARHYGAGLTEIDDFQVILEAMTDPDRHPVFHYWRTHFDEAIQMTEDQHLDFFIRYATAMAAPLSLVIANHIETRTRVVLEGDFILPALAAQETYGEVPAGGQVRALFLYEEDESQIATNYRLREGEDQPGRARISWRVNQWLRAEADRLALPAIPARPWDTALHRAIDAVDAA